MDRAKGVIEHFDIPGDLLKIKPLGSGHINDTYVANFTQGRDEKSYLLQRINKSVFHNPPQLMDNVVRVTDHIKKKLIDQGCDDISRRVLTPVLSRRGSSYSKDEQGDFWRVYIFISGASTYDTVRSGEQAYEIAKAFGGFIHLLRDLPGKALYRTIPHFISGPIRLKQFHDVVARDPHDRVQGAGAEINFLYQHESLLYSFHQLVADGHIPVRTTHNDTKINNVMIDDSTGKGLCVVDLDTVMPGLSLYDFGDLARTTISSRGEDEVDTGKIQLKMDYFESILDGFLAATGAFLVEDEFNNLVLAVKVVAMIIGVRFLTDYLDGDKYFKIRRSLHNLQRCRTQFRLAQLVMEHEEEMLALVQAFHSCR
jgi:hypothetical protein